MELGLALTATSQINTSSAPSLGSNSTWINYGNQVNDANNGEHIGIVLAKISKIIPIAAQQTCLCTFKQRIHPKYDELKSELDAWLQLHRPRDEGIVGYEKLLVSGFDSLVSMANSEGRDEVMLMLMKQMVWFFVLDNCVDNPAHLGADAETSEELVTRLMGVFRTDHPAADRGQDRRQRDNDDDPSTNRGYGKAMQVIVAMGREWWEEMRNAGMSAIQQRRLSSAINDYLNANVEQAKFRQQNHIPDLDTYKSLRVHTSAWLVCSVLIEFALGIELPDALLQHPLLRALQTLVCLCTTFTNDIYSLHRELAEGDLISLVPILLLRQLQHSNSDNHLDDDCIVAAVVSEIIDIVKDLDEQCRRIIDDINALPLPQEDRMNVQKYMHGVSDWMAGSLEWYRCSARYKFE